MKKKILAWLLDAANSSPPYLNRDRFYAYKNYLLEKYGLLVGHDIQHICKYCWKCDGTGLFRGKERCWSCTNGIYNEFYVYLEKYSFCDRIFHKPTHRQYHPYADDPVTIEGYIRKPAHWAHHEAWLWLLLIGCSSWQEFWDNTKSSCSFSYYPLPLTKIQRVIVWVRRESPTPARVSRWVEIKSRQTRRWLHGEEKKDDYDNIPF